MASSTRSRILAGLTLTTFLLTAVSAAAAGEIVVTSLADNSTADDEVTLREAVLAANTDTSIDGSAAGKGPDVIRFARALAGKTITLTEVGDTTYGPSALRVDSVIVIEGVPTAGLTIAGGGALRLFHVSPTGDLTLRALTLRDG